MEASLLRLKTPQTRKVIPRRSISQSSEEGLFWKPEGQLCPPQALGPRSVRAHPGTGPPRMQGGAGGRGGRP